MIVILWGLRLSLWRWTKNWVTKQIPGFRYFSLCLCRPEYYRARPFPVILSGLNKFSILITVLGTKFKGFLNTSTSMRLVVSTMEVNPHIWVLTSRQDEGQRSHSLCARLTAWKKLVSLHTYIHTYTHIHTHIYIRTYMCKIVCIHQHDARCWTTF
jgi:hypothetical protein